MASSFPPPRETSPGPSGTCAYPLRASLRGQLERRSPGRKTATSNSRPGGRRWQPWTRWATHGRQDCGSSQYRVRVEGWSLGFAFTSTLRVAGHARAREHEIGGVASVSTSRPLRGEFTSAASVDPVGSTKDDLFAGVDTAALTLAAVATVTTVAMTDGEWTWFTTFLGVTLTAMLLALHRWSPRNLSLRTILHALAFGFVFTLCMALAWARPLQGLLGDIMADEYAAWWFLVAALAGVLELGFARVYGK